MTKRTNKEKLAKGIRFLAISLVLIFLGPSIIFSAFKNQEHPLYIPVLILGIIIALGAMLMIFLGIKKTVNAFFDD
ncbi:MAG: DUF6095 family protein [Psychroflexus sp.]|jgi:uncharacterized membrane protein|nr:DUF6095 family protein [Psychroflexus sp.]MDR9449477.1 DUF6095 family protein [Psychroflexus sp.]